VKLPRDISGSDLAKCLRKSWEYYRIHQRGSHLILQTDEPGPHRIAVPQHDPLKVGTLSGILDAVARHKGVSRDDILKTL
jgi:predicted RNA binding protein YcfA (HicA-like mRNA interferase family)